MTCPTCTDIREQLKTAASYSQIRELCVRLIWHQLREHKPQAAPLPWSNWPELGVCPACLDERKN